MPIINALTIDVEDYFHVHAFSKAIDPAQWDSFDQRVERNTHRILDLLDEASVQRSAFRVQGYEKSHQSCLPAVPVAKAGQSWQKGLAKDDYGPGTTDNKQPATRNLPTKNSVKATFFVLGWVAQRFPSLVKEIYRRGHEIGCHGLNHKVIFQQTRTEFENDVKRAKELLEGITGSPVLGYRAPTYSITKKTLWAFEVLIELGFLYDSSIFPIKHDYYGFPGAPRFPFRVSVDPAGEVGFAELNGRPGASDAEATGASILEFPLTTGLFLNRRVPVAGGGYFRLFPYRLTRFFLMRVNEVERKPFIFYFHPWELDPEVPRIESAGALSKFRSYVNLDKTEARLRRLLSDFSFSSLISIRSEG
jgi:polysaccharide deacetylase family protein (PEP-CTERM system associated)